MAKVEASSFKALKSFVNTSHNWWQQILNYFDGRLNNGFAERVNLKINEPRRKLTGYHSQKSQITYRLLPTPHSDRVVDR